MQKVVPAILTDDEEELVSKVRLLEEVSEWVHVDIADGVFVPNATLPSSALKNLKTSMKLEVHLMVDKPTEHLNNCRNASRVVVHAEASESPGSVAEAMKEYGFERGVALRHETGTEILEALRSDIHSVLVMSVEPGFQGRKFIQGSLPKVSELRALYPKLLLGMDGALGAENIKKAMDAGLDYAVVGSRIVKTKDPIAAFGELARMVQ